ncbi:MAG: HIRAN domain-containing protein [Pseudomonadota bacterium]|nr:HIRAN domain-containing protein [Pseudomonadota bacterium]
MSLAVVGLDYPNADRSNRRFEMALCVRGEPVHLVPDPKNRADPRAIAVVSARGIQLGYLTAERCGLIGGWLAAGEKHEVLFQEPGHRAAIIRARFGGGKLQLPPARDDIVWDRSEEGGDAFDWGC